MIVKESPVLFGSLLTGGEIPSPLPLEHTQVGVRITGLAASVTVTQRFRNPLTRAANLEYRFPLPHTAAISDFELQIGERRITARIEELEQARQAFARAQRAGQRAGLLEARRPNLFSLQLANVQPGETITTTLHYTQVLEARDDEVEFVFPMGLTPRYNSPERPEEAQGVDVPLAENRAEVGPLALALSLDAGASIATPHSPSHPLQVRGSADGRAWTVDLDGLHLPDHDFILRWSLQADSPCLGAWHTPAQGGDYFMLALLPPRTAAAPAAQAREYVFVLDRSGSMTGEPIRQAVNALRACLRTLNPQDMFSILLFDDRLEWFNARPLPLNQETLRHADAFLDTVQGRGGTELADALYAALTLAPAETAATRQRFIVFLTDGAVSAEQRILEEARRYLHEARIFTFGIGPSVNRALLEQLAVDGRGAAEFLTLDEDIEAAILRFQDRISFPQLTGLRLEWEAAQVWDVYPETLPDLYAGQPLLITGRLRPAGAGPALVRLTGQRAGEPLVLSAPLNPLEDPAVPVGRLWAAKRVESILRRQVFEPQAGARSEIILLGLEHRLVTPYTAFVAVDSLSAEAAGLKIAVAQPLPQGLEMAGFMTPPAPAVSAPPSAPSPRMLFQMAEPKAAAQVQRSAISDEFNRLREIRPPAYRFDPLGVLKQLARTPELNGSWRDDIEWTAAALLAFVRRGHTLRKGSYRRQVSRAFEWLAAASPETLARAGGFAACLRALAFHELAAADAAAALQSASRESIRALPAPRTSLEITAAALLHGRESTAALPPTLGSLDDLRLAVLLPGAGAADLDVAEFNRPGLALEQVYAAALI